ncbi:hypothetical protein ACJ41O_002371 [Fusarium nematophilum]
MHRPTAILALAALSSPAAAAWLKNPFIRSAAESSWTPPRQTDVTAPELEQNLELGWSPAPTQAPELMGRMNMDLAFGKRDLGARTCGFASDGNSFTCITNTATCSFSSGFIGCCETGRSCNVVKTTCIDYDASASGACDLPDDFHTLCCGTSALGSCFTWVLSTGEAEDDMFTLLDCSARGGTSTLLNFDPLATTTDGGDETSTTNESESSTTDAEPTDSTEGASTTESASASASSDNGGDNGGDDDNGGSSTNVGAIAGGTVGGVAALGLVGLAGFLLFRRRNKQTTPPATAAAAAGGDHSQMPPAMAQNPQSPGQSFAPSSPSNAAYPSGVPSNYQPGGYQQPYDPNMAAAYGQQQSYSPQPQPGFGAYSPQQSFQGQYSQQQGYGQQGQYPAQFGAAGYAAPSTASPPPHLTPSPGPKEGGDASLAGQSQTPAQQQQHHASELPAVNPLGNENNRAELG